ncbi:MAG: DUF3887 domain-containing protein [Lachnospiraceae bacterium]|nr:DUF3887 domain-containing protein [Lachnospiraceae bacterium]
MIGKRVLLAAACFLLIAGFVTGCQKKTDTKEESGRSVAISGSAVSGTAADSDSSTVSGSAGDAESELAKKSRNFANQIVSGLYAPMMEDFTAELANQTGEENLRASFQSIAGNLTGYEGIESVEESENGEYHIVLVTLRYGNNQGRTIQFVYDKQEKIAGLWFDVTLLRQNGEEKEDTYEETEVIVGREPYALKGKLLLPEKEEKVPVVILIPGKDDMDMDGSIGNGENTPIRDLARGLAARGIASLRYNKRGFQYAYSLPESAGIYDTLTEDVGYAVDLMYNTREIDADRIYLVAQGKAADYLPALVQRKERRLAGAAMLAGKPIQTTETIYAEKKKAVKCDAKYWIETNSTLPLLILQGESDFETPMVHYEKWQELLKGRSHVTYHSYQKLNHYFMTSAGKTDTTEYDSTGSVSQSVIRDLADWITGQ